MFSTESLRKQTRELAPKFPYKPHARKGSATEKKKKKKAKWEKTCYWVKKSLTRPDEQYKDDVGLFRPRRKSGLSDSRQQTLGRCGPQACPTQVASSLGSHQGSIGPLLRSPRGSWSHWPTWQPLPARPLPGPTSRWPWSGGKWGRLAKEFTARAPTPVPSPLSRREPPPRRPEAVVPKVTPLPARRKASLFRAAPGVFFSVASSGRLLTRVYRGLEHRCRALNSPGSAKSNS